jgi:hypothetical protein
MTDRVKTDLALFSAAIFAIALVLSANSSFADIMSLLLLQGR